MTRIRPYACWASAFFTSATWSGLAKTAVLMALRMPFSRLAEPSCEDALAPDQQPVVDDEVNCEPLGNRCALWLFPVPLLPTSAKVWGLRFKPRSPRSFQTGVGVRMQGAPVRSIHRRRAPGTGCAGRAARAA